MAISRVPQEVGIASVTVKVPATTANLGPGFDCLGAALSLYNGFTFTPLPTGTMPAMQLRVNDFEPLSSRPPAGGEASGFKSEASRLTTGADNLVYRAFLALYQQVRRSPPPVAITIDLGIPLARGLGSSATAIVGGLLGANELAGAPLNQGELLQLAIALEGHPDNVVPALLGGCCLAVAGDQDLVISDIPWHGEIVPVVAIPDFELSTQEARQVLPTTYSRGDAIFNAAHLGLLVRGLATGQGDWLQAALQDRIHQPYRQALIPGYAAVAEVARAAGAWGLVISGAGPTLLALVPAGQTEPVIQAITTTWQTHRVLVKALDLDTQGATLSTR